MLTLARPWMWFGKLPGMGDFAHRHMPDTTLTAVDAWLQSVMAGMAQRHPGDWVDHYLAAPVWRFVLGPQLIRVGSGEGPAPMLAGICMPSVDRVGRYFPLLVLGSLTADQPDERLDWRATDRVLGQMEATALSALDDDWDAQRFDDALIRMASGGDEPEPGHCVADPWPDPPGAGHSVWYHHGGGQGNTALTLEGLPTTDIFCSMMGY